MKMRRGRAAARMADVGAKMLSAAAMCFVIATAHADEPRRAEKDSMFEITPFAGYRMGGDFDVAGSRQNASLDDHAAFSLGAGFRVPVTENFGLRLEARGYLTLIDTDSSVFCASGSFGGVCSIRARGSTFTQFEVMAGASFRF